MMKRSRRIFEALFGACLVYTAMAACNGGGSPSSGGHGHGGQAHGGGGPGGAMAGPGGSDGSGIMDALMDPVADAMADPTSGSRLKAAWIESTDGARQFLLNTEIDSGTGVTVTRNVWYDSMRDEECTIRLASDGTLRCLPGFPQAVPPAQTGQIFFSDTTCGQAYMVVNNPPVNCAPYAAPDYSGALVTPPTSCQTPGENGRVRVFKRGNSVVLPPGTTLYIPNSAPGMSPPCVPQTSSDQYASIWNATEVDPSKFAEFKTAVKHDP